MLNETGVVVLMRLSDVADDAILPLDVVGEGDGFVVGTIVGDELPPPPQATVTVHKRNAQKKARIIKTFM